MFDIFAFVHTRTKGMSVGVKKFGVGLDRKITAYVNVSSVFLIRYCNELELTISHLLSGTTTINKKCVIISHLP